MYDTGASPFTLVLAPEIFDALRRQRLVREVAKPFTVPAFGKPVPIRAGRLRGVVSIGRASYSNPLVYETALAAGVDAVLGNGVFSKSTVVVDIPGRRFGIVPSTTSP